jgi:hypothetical protein
LANLHSQAVLSPFIAKQERIGEFIDKGVYTENERKAQEEFNRMKWKWNVKIISPYNFKAKSTS